jgi:HlyD family secretion protein
MRNFFIITIVLSILLPSCKPKATNLVTVDLKRSDYSDMITASGTIQAVVSTPIMAPMGYFGEMTVARAIPEGSFVEKGDTLCVLECAPMMQELDKQKKDLESLQAEFKKQEADNALNRAVLDARIKENKAGMAISELDSVQIRFAPRVKQQLMGLELEKAHIEEKKLQKKFEAEKKIDESEIRQLKSRIIQAENLVKSMQEQASALTILAPKSGMVIKSEMAGRMMISFGEGDPIEIGGYPKTGSLIFPEMALMQLPDLDQMQVLVKVQEVDYKRIEKGQKVEITVDSKDKLRTTGSVKLKSLAGRSGYDSKVKWYDVTVSVDSCHLQMSPGLSARCDIFINQVKDTVVVPTVAIFEKDSLKVVYVEEGDKFRPVPVETGLNNSSKTIITKGLTGTETIALMEPPQKIVIKTNKKPNE